MNFLKIRQPSTVLLRVWFVWVCVIYPAIPTADDGLVGTNKYYPPLKAELKTVASSSGAANSGPRLSGARTDNAVAGQSAETEPTGSGSESGVATTESESGAAITESGAESATTESGAESATTESESGAEIFDTGSQTISTDADADGGVGTSMAVGRTLALRPYVAEYYLRVRGHEVGLLTVVMSKTDDGWLRQNIAIASGLAILFTNTVLEDSLFSLGADGSIVPQSYYLRNRNVNQWVKAGFTNAGTDMHVEFFNVKKIDDGVVERRREAGGARLLDDTLWMVQAAIDYLGGHLPQRYDIVGISGIRAHELVFERREDYQIGDVVYPCVVLKRIRLGKENDHVLLRLAEDRGYVPVSMERYKKGKRLFQLHLSAVAFD